MTLANRANGLSAGLTKRISVAAAAGEDAEKDKSPSLVSLYEELFEQPRETPSKSVSRSSLSFSLNKVIGPAWACLLP